MEENIIEMIKNGNLIVGKIKYLEGFAVFERLSLEDALKLKPEEIAFATQSMGRGIFRIEDSNRIMNIKGVDSHQNTSENTLSVLSNAKTQLVITDGSISFADSIHPVSLVIFPGKKADIRIRGASPLEDLEIEAEVNHRMQNFGIKVPKIKQIREYPIDVAEKLCLPIKTKTRSKQISCDYEEEDRERKEYLREVFGRAYSEELPEGYRPEYISEFFDRLGISDDPAFISFAEKNGITVKEFTDYGDNTYSLGQRYGQTIRLISSPFRISDIEFYIQKNDIKAIERIAAFTKGHSESKEPFELTFARQMGENIARFMNAGWLTNNMCHRQDYSILGEMCDDSYFDLQKYLAKCDEEIIANQDDSFMVNKYEGIKRDKIDHFYSQFMHFGSCLKVLQDEMRLRDLPHHQIDNVMNEFIRAFTKTISFKKIGNSLDIDPNEAEESFRRMLSSKDFAKEMAKIRHSNGFIYDEQILHCHERNNDFYNELSNKVAKSMNLDLDNEFNLITKIINLKDEEIDFFIQERTNLLEDDATELRSELSMFTISCSRINGRGESSEVIGFIPSNTRVKKWDKDLSSFNVDDLDLYRSLITYIKKVDPNLLINNGKLCNDNVMRLVQAVIIDYFGLFSTEEDRSSLYESKSGDESFSISEFKRNKTALSVERAAVAQNLLSFLGYNPMMVYGYLSRENDKVNSDHVFNIIMRNGKATVADFTNPIYKDGHFYQTALYSINADRLENFKKGKGILDIDHMSFHNNGQGEVEEELERWVYSSEEIDPKFFERRRESGNIDY